MKKSNKPEDALLKVSNIKKSFPGVNALINVDFDLKPGEIHGLVGENGAGKSTLIKILSGVYRPDSGIIRVGNFSTSYIDTTKSKELGIFTIYQENKLIPYLTVAENIFLGQERVSKIAMFRWKEVYRMAGELLSSLNLDIQPRLLAKNLSISEQQGVQIAKAMVQKSKVLIFDEATASYGKKDVDNLFFIINSLKEQGKGIIYITHQLDEVFDIADRVTILRDGRYINTYDIGDITHEGLIREMVGRNINMGNIKQKVPIGKEELKVYNFCWKDIIHDVSFKVKQGEILGLYGLVGAGRTELAKLMVGAIKADKGKIFLNGKELNIKNPEQSILSGLCLITEDRQKTGLMMNRDIKENITLAGIHKFRGLFINPKQDKAVAKEYVNQLKIKTSSIFKIVKNLSGGNQQKVILSKWFFVNCKIYIFDEPTKGIDIGAREEIYRLFMDLIKKNKIIIIITSDMEELLSISDRILIMKEGSIIRELSGEECTQEKILNYCLKG